MWATVHIPVVLQYFLIFFSCGIVSIYSPFFKSIVLLNWLYFYILYFFLFIPCMLMSRSDSIVSFSYTAGTLASWRWPYPGSLLHWWDKFQHLVLSYARTLKNWQTGSPKKNFFQRGECERFGIHVVPRSTLLWIAWKDYTCAIQRIPQAVQWHGGWRSNVHIR